MSLDEQLDERIRSLERRAATGDSDAAAELIRARVRIGELPAGLLKLEPGDG